MGQYFRAPTGFGGRKQVQGVAELCRCQFCFFEVVTIRLIDDDPVRHLHDPALDALQFVSSTGKLDQQEEIDHRVDSRLALSDTDRFDKYRIESGSFAKNDRFTCFTGNAT